MVAQLYWQQRVVVRVGGDTSESVNIEHGVRQGCLLFPDIFSKFTQRVIEELKDMDVVKMDVRKISSIS